VIDIGMYYAWFLAKGREKQPLEVPAN